jgi:AraC-like DNA-binding protein
MTKTPPSIAATSTHAMVRAAEVRGVQTADLLQREGLTRAFLEDPDARIPAPSVMAIWEGLRERTGDPALQLDAPRTLPWGAYRVVDYLVAASATVGDGMERFARFFGIISDAVTLKVAVRGGEHSLCLETAGGGHVPPMYVDYTFAALITRMRMYMRASVRLLRVELRQPRPPWHEANERFFEAPVRFGALRDCLALDEAEWRLPLASADEALARLMEDHGRMLVERGAGGPSGFKSDVVRALTATLPEGGSAKAVAKVLHVSVRTLQRRLVEAGTSFRELADTVRSQVAQGYLSDPGVSSAEVAFLLGFSDPSSFNRAFRRWTGKSPGRWRKDGGVKGA